MPSPDRQFTASYDWTTKVVAAVVFAIAIFVFVLTRSVIAGSLGAALIVMSYAWSPRGYAISERTIIVKRLIGNVRIPLDAIREARAATKDDFRGCIRLWGNGGLFGYYGTFQMSKLGTSTWYLTNRGNAVIVTTTARTVLLSPDDVAGFLAVIRQVAPIAQPTGGEFAGAPLPGGKFPTGAWVGVAVGVVAVGFVTFAVTYAPGAPAYTLTHDTLAIHDRFYPVTLKAGDIDVDRIRTVDIASDPEWRPTARTNGFSNSHYHSGWFRVASGTTVRMYWADATKLLLLPPKGSGAPVLLQVNNPERFEDEVRREWVSH